jgi:hypothetical protein
MRQELEHIGRGKNKRILRDDVQNAFRSNATARSMLGRARPDTNSR